MRRRRNIGILFLVLLCMSMVGCRRAKSYDTPQEAIAGAWKYFSDGEIDFAIDTFEAVLAETPPGSEEQLASWYGLGMVWSLRRPGQDNERAREYFQKIVQTNPQHELAAWGMLALARIEYLADPGKDPDYAKVGLAYQEVIDAHPKSLAGQEAFLCRQSLRLMTFEKEDAKVALRSLQEYVQEFSGSLYESAGYQLMAIAYWVLKDPENQLRAYCKCIETIEVDPKNPFFERSGHYWAAATLAEFKVGDFDTARHYYRKLIDEYPNDVRVYVSRRALKRMDAMEAKLRQELAEENP